MDLFTSFPWCHLIIFIGPGPESLGLRTGLLPVSETLQVSCHAFETTSSSYEIKFFFLLDILTVTLKCIPLFPEYSSGTHNLSVQTFLYIKYFDTDCQNLYSKDMGGGHHALKG